MHGLSAATWLSFQQRIDLAVAAEVAARWEELKREMATAREQLQSELVEQASTPQTAECIQIGACVSVSM
jgi:hypothetical protein